MRARGKRHRPAGVRIPAKARVDHVTVAVTDDDTTLEILRDFDDGAVGANWTDNSNWLATVADKPGGVPTCD